MFSIFKKKQKPTRRTTYSLIPEPVVLKMADVIHTNQINRYAAVAEQRQRETGLEWHVVEQNSGFEVFNDRQVKILGLTPKYTSGKGFNFI